MTKDEVAKAREMDLLTYLRRYEPEELIHFSGSTYCTRTHDSLKISNGMWYWWSRGIGGRSALDYLIKVKGVELRQAVENPLGVRTLAGIKYRAWATTGRCQGGYCLPKIAQMLVEDYGLAPEDVTYRGEGSPLFAGRVK